MMSCDLMLSNLMKLIVTSPKPNVNLTLTQHTQSRHRVFERVATVECGYHSSQVRPVDRGTCGNLGVRRRVEEAGEMAHQPPLSIHTN